MRFEDVCGWFDDGAVECEDFVGCSAFGLGGGAGDNVVEEGGIANESDVGGF